MNRCITISEELCLKAFVPPRLPLLILKLNLFRIRNIIIIITLLDPLTLNRFKCSETIKVLHVWLCIIGHFM